VIRMVLPYALRSSGNIKLYLQTQPRFRLQRHCKLLPSAAPSMSNLVIHSSVPCYSPLNLVWSPNPTPPLSPLPCNAMESTSALGRESTNLTREPKNEAEPKEIRNYCHETLKPWLACFFVHFHYPVCPISCLQISPPFPSLSMLKRTVGRRPDGSFMCQITRGNAYATALSST
jgi:hypothetical protein